MKLWLLLGRRDTPTDGIEDYCQLLAGALGRRGHKTEVVRLSWMDRGWWAGLWGMRKALTRSRVEWVIMQFTPLMWSRRGFPVRALAVAGVVRLAGISLCTLIHDPSGFPGKRLRDRTRRAVQHGVMRALVRISQQSVVTVERKEVPWLSADARHAPRTIPVGSNILPAAVGSRDGDDIFTISIFAITEGRRDEAYQIAEVANRVASELGGVQLLLFGRGVEIAAPWVEQKAGTGVRIRANGVLPSHDVSDWLRRSNAMLFIRGTVSSRRTTVISAIAHGLPVVGYRGEETGQVITEAGVSLVPSGDAAGLVRELVRIASDPQWAAELRQRSADAYERYFSWDRIAGLFVETLSCAR